MSNEEPEQRQGTATPPNSGEDQNTSPDGEHPPAHNGHRHVRVMSEHPTIRPSGLLASDEEPQTAQGHPDAGQGQSTHKIKADLRHEQVVKGAHPGDRYIRYGRNVGPFRRKSGGILAASLEAETPRSKFGQYFNNVKRTVIGRPISSEHSIHERLTKVKALAVLSSDALSSVAYATEEILRVLILVGMGLVATAAMPVGFAVMLLLLIVAISYRQTIAEYPRGGGSYIVAKDNLGTMAGLTAAASILIDYTLTVAVSVSSGMDAIISLFPGVLTYKVEICLAVVFLITVANLRGVREAGNIFAVPTYLFIAGILGMLILGVARLLLTGGIHYTPPPETMQPGNLSLTGFAFAFLILRAFSQGCTALTGVEAISDGVPAFKPPEANNARTTLLWMAGLAVTMFGGITFLATQIHILPSEQETVLSQVARNVFDIGPGWFSGSAWYVSDDCVGAE